VKVGSTWFPEKGFPMAMNRIGRPQLIQPHIVDQFHKSSPPPEEESRRLGGSAETKSRSDTGTDRLEISDHARKLDDLRRTLEASRQALSLAPDVRQERIAQVRERLQKGYYNSEKVRRDIATRLVTVIKRLDSWE
jgi:hypothetical protein